MEIKRYHIEPEDGACWEFERPDGDWVRYDDIAELLIKTQKYDAIMEVLGIDNGMTE